MANVLLPLQPGTLPSGACYTTEQERLVAFAGQLWAVLNGQAFFSFGPDKPDPEFNSYPWFNTTLGIWFTYSGGWIAPNPEQSQLVRRIWTGSDGAPLQAYDGGDGNAPSDRSGPMWEVDTDFAARFPVGPGTFPNTTVVAVGGTGGEDEHVLTDEEVPDTSVVPLDGNGDVYTTNQRFQKSGEVTALSFTNGDFTGTDSGGRMTDVLAKVDGGGEGHNNLPPYIGTYFIKRTSRVYYLIP